MTRRIGVHLGTQGGPSNAVLRANEIGANTLQIFSSSPRMWRPATIDPVQAERMHTFRAKYDIAPLAVHTSYLVNLCSQTMEVREKSIVCLRGEIERALTLGADYLVLHPGSWKGLSRHAGLTFAAESIERAMEGIPWQSTGFTLLIENTAGSECSLGGASTRWPNWCGSYGRMHPLRSVSTPATPTWRATTSFRRTATKAP